MGDIDLLQKVLALARLSADHANVDGEDKRLSGTGDESVDALDRANVITELSQYSFLPRDFRLLTRLDTFLNLRQVAIGREMLLRGCFVNRALQRHGVASRLAQLMKPYALADAELLARRDAITDTPRRQAIASVCQVSAEQLAEAMWYSTREVTGFRFLGSVLEEPPGGGIRPDTLKMLHDLDLSQARRFGVAVNSADFEQMEAAGAESKMRHWTGIYGDLDAEGGPVLELFNPTGWPPGVEGGIIASRLFKWMEQAAAGQEVAIGYNATTHQGFDVKCGLYVIWFLRGRAVGDLASIEASDRERDVSLRMAPLKDELFDDYDADGIEVVLANADLAVLMGARAALEMAARTTDRHLVTRPLPPTAELLPATPPAGPARDQLRGLWFASPTTGESAAVHAPAAQAAWPGADAFADRLALLEDGALTGYLPTQAEEKEAPFYLRAECGTLEPWSVNMAGAPVPLRLLPRPHRLSLGGFEWSSNLSVYVRRAGLRPDRDFYDFVAGLVARVPFWGHQAAEVGGIATAWLSSDAVERGLQRAAGLSGRAVEILGALAPTQVTVNLLTVKRRPPRRPRRAYDWLMMGLNISPDGGSHWVLLAADLGPDGWVVFVDPFGNTPGAVGPAVAQIFRLFGLAAEALAGRRLPWLASEHKYQKDGFQCGVWVVYVAEMLLRNTPPKDAVNCAAYRQAVFFDDKPPRAR